LRHAPFKGRKPVYVGDDRTDEDGFRAALVAGGHGVKVGREITEARFRLASVPAVHAWLAASLDALETGVKP
jgi:trehalose 6-phosphate phosphatase